MYVKEPDTSHSLWRHWVEPFTKPDFSQSRIIQRRKCYKAIHDTEPNTAQSQKRHRARYEPDAQGKPDTQTYVSSEPEII